MARPWSPDSSRPCPPRDRRLRRHGPTARAPPRPRRGGHPLEHRRGQTGGLWPWPETRARPQQGRVGERSARRLSSGLDLAETRPYQAGDDPRRVHWRATARTGQLQVCGFHQDKQPTVCCVVDRGPRMRFGTRGRLKVTQAARLALLIAAQEQRQGSELAPPVLDPARHWLPPILGAAALHRLAACVAAPPRPCLRAEWTAGARSGPSLRCA